MDREPCATFDVPDVGCRIRGQPLRAAGAESLCRARRRKLPLRRARRAATPPIKSFAPSAASPCPLEASSVVTAAHRFRLLSRLRRCPNLQRELRRSHRLSPQRPKRRGPFRSPPLLRSHPRHASGLPIPRRTGRAPPPLILPPPLPRTPESPLSLLQRPPRSSRGSANHKLMPA